MPAHILGISAYYHDSAACLVSDGRIVAAAQEERFTRKRHDAAFPTRAVEYCLREAGITPADLQLIGFYEKPIVKFQRLLETTIAYAPRGLRSYLMAMPVWLAEKLWMADHVRAAVDCEAPVLFGEHHESHAASAFYPSPFEEAAILTVDGVGEWATSSIGMGRGHRIELLHHQRFPHSLGLLYSAFTYFTGFTVNSGEYKLMGLAPYGEPRYEAAIREHIVDIDENGGLWLNMDYFNYGHGLTMTGRRFEQIFGGPRRAPESKITQREMDIARSIQQVTEEAVIRMARFAHRETGARHLCMAGGVALNCVANGRLLREGPFESIWIQPASGDAGGALGVAMSLWHHHLDKPRESAERAGKWQRPVSGAARPACYADAMSGAFLGPSFSSDDVQQWIQAHGYPAHRLDRPALAREIAAKLDQGLVVGLVQGRMEFGPRALGARSIIGDPRSAAMQSVMNLKIKYRESFRPFAPAVLREHVSDWFDLDSDSPYMLLVADVARKRLVGPRAGASQLWGIERLNEPRSEIPAVTHVDNSARVQTVRAETHGMFHDILSAFYERTGCPVLVNTSFNVRGEPIVCTPEDAYRCFRRTEMDVLVVEDFIFEKSEQPPMEDDGTWRQVYGPD